MVKFYYLKNIYMRLYIFILLVFLIILYFYYYLIKNTNNHIKYKFKFYKIKNERKSLTDLDNNVISQISYINSKYKNHTISKKNIQNNMKEFNYNYKNARDICHFNYATNAFSENVQLINNFLIKLNNIEKDMVDKSNNYTKTSCDILDKTTFYNAFNIINSIIFLFSNNIDKYYFTHIIQYYEFLYDKYTLLYRYINKNNIVNISNIKTIFISSHHEACEWIFKEFTNDKIPTILHVDSHPDLNPYYNPNKLFDIKNNINNNENIKELYTDILSNDIGSVIAPSINPYKYNGGFYWLIPKWVPNKNIEKGIFTQIIKNNANEECTNIIWDGDSKDLDDNDHDTVIKNLTPINCNSAYVDDFFKFNHHIENGYILNIDLDYFVTAGEHNSIYDPVSHNRTTIDSQRIKKDAFYSMKKNKEINNEINIIRKRIDHFIILIRKLKNINKIPSFIILCNSSQRNINLFHEPWFDVNNNIYSLMDSHNEYTPKYLSIWLQHTLLMHLKEIFE